MLKLYQHLVGLGYPVVGVSTTPNGGYTASIDDTTTEQIRAEIDDIVASWQDPPEPNWTGFRTALYAEDAWKRVLNSNPAVGATIASILWQFQTDPTLAAEVKFLWDSLIPGLDPALSVDEITALNLIAIDNNVPMVVEDDGFLSFSD